MNSNVKSYTIGDHAFEQRKLVWGQELQIRELFRDLNQGLTDQQQGIDLLQVLEPVLPRFCAIVLREPGKLLREKDLADLTAYLEETIDTATAAAVVNDFLACTPLAETLEAMTSLVTAIGGMIVTRPSSSSAASAALAEETSPAGTLSSGAIPRMSAESTSKSEAGNASSESR